MLKHLKATNAMKLFNFNITSLAYARLLIWQSFYHEYLNPI